MEDKKELELLARFRPTSAGWNLGHEMLKLLK